MREFTQDYVKGVWDEYHLDIFKRTYELFQIVRFPWKNQKIQRRKKHKERKYAYLGHFLRDIKKQKEIEEF